MIWNGPSAAPGRSETLESVFGSALPPKAGETTVAWDALPPGEDCFKQTSADYARLARDPCVVSNADSEPSPRQA